MGNYAPSTRSRIADLILGMRVDTGNKDVSDLVHLHQAQVEDFNVYGTILLMHLFMEVETALSNDAALFQYTYSCPLHTGGAITSTKLGTVSGSIAALSEGSRVI